MTEEFEKAARRARDAVELSKRWGVSVKNRRLNAALDLHYARQKVFPNTITRQQLRRRWLDMSPLARPHLWKELRK